MTSLFTRKEYQYDIGNISHIHLPGKLLQFSKQSRTELLDLIRNNFVDIIKPKEVDDLIKEGIVEQKDDVIHMQLDGLTFIIHECKSQCLVTDKYRKLIFCEKNDLKS